MTVVCFAVLSVDGAAAGMTGQTFGLLRLEWQ